MGMSVTTSKELIRCSICNKIVPKQQYCPKCGKLLIKNYKGSIPKAKDPSHSKKEEKTNTEDETSESEQLENLNEKLLALENGRKKAIEEESKQIDLILEKDEEEKEEDVVIGGASMAKTMESKDIFLDDNSLNIVDVEVADQFVYTPDKYTMDAVQKLAKNVRFQAHLVKMLKDEEMNEETFIGLYKGLADDTHRLIQRRGETVQEIDSSIGGYQNTIKIAQQGMKLLDIRRSIDDVSEEEYKVKSAAFKWDLNHYGQKIKSEESKANYLRNLGSLIEADELNSLIDDVNDSLNVLSKLSVSDGTRKMLDISMKEALTLLKETNSF
jgi:hypothetical protein